METHVCMYESDQCRDALTTVLNVLEYMYSESKSAKVGAAAAVKFRCIRS